LSPSLSHTLNSLEIDASSLRIAGSVAIRAMASSNASAFWLGFFLYEVLTRFGVYFAFFLDADCADKRGLTDSELRSISIRNQLFVDSASAKALCFIFSLEMNNGRESI
jgi:hypothetical protein